MRAYRKLLVASILCLFADSWTVSSAEPMDGRYPDKYTAPPVMLWIWSHAEDLSWLKSKNVGISYLAGTLKIRADRMVFTPRLTALQVPEGIDVETVIRIESAEAGLLDENIIDDIAKIICRHIDKTGARSLQIDFDARLSERENYRKLLEKLRSSLPARCDLSITALASWLSHDKWTKRLPVTKIVPMLFRMGREKQDFIEHIEKHGKLAGQVFPAVLGFAIDELDVFDKVIGESVDKKSIRQVYIFAPRGWKREEYRCFVYTLVDMFEKPE